MIQLSGVFFQKEVVSVTFGTTFFYIVVLSESLLYGLEANDFLPAAPQAYALPSYLILTFCLFFAGLGCNNN